MSKKILAGPSEERLPYSKAVRAGDMVYISGMVAFDKNWNIVEGGITAETHQVLGDLKSLMTEIGGKLSDIVKMNICLPYADDFDDFNTVYAEFFPEEPPARATICAGLTLEARVEIEAIAYMPE